MPPRQPKSPSYSDIDLANWKDYPEILTDSLWQFPSRKNVGTHVGDYHGNFIPQVAEQIMLRYSKQGDTVLDMFLGMGTSLIECRRLGRNGVGIELLPHIAERSQARIEATENPHDVKTIVVNGSSADAETHAKVRQALVSLEKDAADLIFLHPPYSDIIRFSNGENPDDLSTVSSDDEFVERFGEVARASFELLAPGRFMALVIGDKYAKGEWVPGRAVYLQHASDPISWWSPRLILREPDWLNEARGRDVLPAMHWIPFVTFLQVSADMAVSTGVPDGHGHFYLAAIPAAWAEILQPPGWTPEKTEKLIPLLSRD